MIKAVEAMRLRVEGLEASVSDSVEASARREAAAALAGLVLRPVLFCVYFTYGVEKVRNYHMNAIIVKPSI